MDIYGSLYAAFKENDYVKFLKLFRKYLKKGFGVDTGLIRMYAIALRKTNRYEEGLKLLLSLKEDVVEYGNQFFFATILYTFCRPREGLELLSTQKFLSMKEKIFLAKLHIQNGDYQSALVVLNECASCRDRVVEVQASELINKIWHHLSRDVMIEMSYDSFLDNGFSLEPGHIVFLKKEVKYCLVEDNQDEKKMSRPYLIWKIDGDTLYLFPVSSSTKCGGYKLYQQFYDNNVGDRIIKNNFCLSTKQNVLSVQDKVTAVDFKRVMNDLFFSFYFSSKVYDEKMLEMFYEEFNRKANRGDIVVIIDPQDKIKRYYLITEVLDGGYEAYPIDRHSKEIIGDKVFIDSSQIILGIVKLPDEEKLECDRQLSLKMRNYSS